MNNCIFIGRTTRDIEIGTSSAGKVYGRTSIAVDSGYGDSKKTSFFNITAFGKTAESMEKYVPKGTKIAVQSEAVQNSYTDKDGNKRSDVSFIVRTWEFAEGKGSSESSGDVFTPQTVKRADADGFMHIPDALDDTELPF